MQKFSITLFKESRQDSIGYTANSVYFGKRDLQAVQSSNSWRVSKNEAYLFSCLQKFCAKQRSEFHIFSKKFCSRVRWVYLRSLRLKCTKNPLKEKSAQVSFRWVTSSCICLETLSTSWWRRKSTVNTFMKDRELLCRWEDMPMHVTEIHWF